MVQQSQDPEGDLAQNLTALGGALKALDGNPPAHPPGEADAAVNLRSCFRGSPSLCLAAAFGTGLLAGAWTARKKMAQPPSSSRPKPFSRTSQTWDAIKSAALTTGASFVLDFIRGSARVAKASR